MGAQSRLDNVIKMGTKTLDADSVLLYEAREPGMGDANGKGRFSERRSTLGWMLRQIVYRAG